MKIETYLDYKAILSNQSFPVHLALRLEAPELDAKRTKPIALSLVIDASGSMQGPPIEAAKEAARVVVRNLRKNDWLSIVVFDDTALAVVPMQTVGKQNAILERINLIGGGGSTNLTAGYMLGRDTLREAPKDLPRRLLLLSDGHLNTGIVDPAQVEQVVADGLECDRVRTSCLGFGDSYDENLLSALANKTGGTFYDARQTDEFPKIFASELEGLQQISVQNLRLRFKKLTFCEGVMLLSAYPFTQLPDGRIELTIGDLISEEERTLILALEVLPIPPVPAGLGDASMEGEDLIEIEAIWDQISKAGISSATWKQTVQVRAVQDPAKVTLDSRVIPWVATQRAGHAVKDALRASDLGKLDEAVGILKKNLHVLEALGHSGDVEDGLNLLKEILHRIEQEGQISARSRKMSLYVAEDYARMSDSTHFSASGDIREPSYKRRRPRRPSKD